MTWHIFIPTNNRDFIKKKYTSFFFLQYKEIPKFYSIFLFYKFLFFPWFHLSQPHIHKFNSISFLKCILLYLLNYTGVFINALLFYFYILICCMFICLMPTNIVKIGYACFRIKNKVESFFFFEGKIRLSHVLLII